MKLLQEIVRHPGLNFQGRTLQRKAVRAIILKDRKLLMVYSAKKGDYKFPGGGLNSGETHRQALARELLEECGASISEIGLAFGKIIEYALPHEADYTVFKMTSYYYLCQVDAIFQEQQLEQYEAKLGFQPVWIDLDEALCANQAILSANHAESSAWVKRETFMLEQIKQKLFQDDYVRHL